MKVAILVQHIRFKLIRLGFNQLLEIYIIPNRNEGLHVELETQRRGKTNVRTCCKIQGATYEPSINVVFFDRPIKVLLNLFNPLCIVNLITIHRSQVQLDIACRTDTDAEIYISESRRNMSNLMLMSIGSGCAPIKPNQ